MAITIKDIARRAGVSHSTVSRALRDDPAIPPATTQRLKRLARRLGYVPSAMARGLKTSHSGVLGVVVSNIADPFLGEVVRGIEDGVLDAGYSLFLADSHRDAERAAAILRALTERRVEGVIICSSAITPAQLKALGQFGLPLVLVNNLVAVPPARAYGLAIDDLHGGRLLTEHLLSLGHRRIAYLGNALGGQASLDRRAGYRAALAAAGLAPHPAWELTGPTGRPEGGVAGAEAFLALEPRPTALFCFNDLMALGALQRLKQAGLRLPQAVSVGGFDDIFLAAYTDPPLTTIAQPKYQLGRDAAALLCSLLSSGAKRSPTAPRIRSLPGALVVRGSTAPPPGAP
ncbi:MAG: LacI family DNA-binding transcriptional regulator [Anaerolineales bacterium]|nr:LacI family DNA-binding transcriptional regulator [Anaerolineales bacterium]